VPTFLQNLPHHQHSRTSLLTLWIILFPQCLVESHYMPLCVMNLWPNLLPVHFLYCYRRAGCLLTSAVGTVGELRTKVLWEEVMNKQFTHWLKYAASPTGINLCKKHPELADLEDSTKFHDNVCGRVKPPTPSSPALFVFHSVICTNRSKDANSSFHPFSWYTKTDFGS
jgi:hypothetical protein